MNYFVLSGQWEATNLGEGFTCMVYSQVTNMVLSLVGEWVRGWQASMHIPKGQPYIVSFQQRKKVVDMHASWTFRGRSPSGESCVRAVQGYRAGEGTPVFNSGGGVFNRASKNWEGGGVWGKKAQLRGTNTSFG